MMSLGWNDPETAYLEGLRPTPPRSPAAAPVARRSHAMMSLGWNDPETAFLEGLRPPRPRPAPPRR